VLTIGRFEDAPNWLCGRPKLEWQLIGTKIGGADDRGGKSLLPSAMISSSATRPGKQIGFGEPKIAR